MENITKDPAYNAVDPNDFPAMLDVNRYGERSNAFDKIISATHDHFWDPLDKKYIDFSAPFDMTNEYLVNPELNADLRPPSATSSTRSRRSSSSISMCVVVLVDPARRAGRAVAVGIAVPHPARSGRAGICRQPDARRGAPRHGVHALHPRALGQAGAGRPRAGRSAERTRGFAARVEEARRHADAGRGSRDGRVSPLSTRKRAIR
jgi:hypothetical protein